MNAKAELRRLHVELDSLLGKVGNKLQENIEKLGIDNTFQVEGATGEYEILQLLGKGRAPVYLVRNTTTEEKFSMKMFFFTDDETKKKASDDAQVDIDIVDLIKERSGTSVFCENLSVCPARKGIVTTRKTSAVVVLSEWFNTVPLDKFCLETLWPMAETNPAEYETMVKKFVLQLFTALEYMHRAGLFHMDIKPENCVIQIKDDDHLLRLIDFGNSRAIDKFNLFESTPEGLRPGWIYETTQSATDPLCMFPGAPTLINLERQYVSRDRSTDQKRQRQREQLAIMDYLRAIPKSWGRLAQMYTSELQRNAAFRHHDVYAAAYVASYLMYHNAKPLFEGNTDLKLLGIWVTSAVSKPPMPRGIWSAQRYYEVAFSMSPAEAVNMFDRRPPVREDYEMLNDFAYQILFDELGFNVSRKYIESVIGRKVERTDPVDRQRALESFTETILKHNPIPVVERIVKLCSNPDLKARYSAQDASDEIVYHFQKEG